MAYTRINFPSKKKLKEAVAHGDRVEVFQPGGIFPDPPPNGTVFLEGPHYPQPHRWYAQAELKDGAVVKVK